MSSDTPAAVVTRFLRAFECFDFDTMSSLMDDHVRLSLPTAPAGVQREIVGKAAFTGFLSHIEKAWRKFSLAQCDVHPLADDPNRVIAAYTSDGQNADGSPYRNSYLTMVEVRQGKVTSFQEFFDPEPLAAAIGIAAAQQH